MKTVLSLLSVVALASCGNAGPTQRIVGGWYTSDGDYPEVVSVYNDPLLGSAYHLCGGIILNDNHVLTTAACVQDYSAMTLYVMGAGTNIDESTGYEEHKSVDRVFRHANYDPVTRENDLAILRLSHNFVFVSGLISPAKLPASNAPVPSTGSHMTAVGWGKDGVDGVMQEQQKAVNLTFLTSEECKEVFGTFVLPTEGCLEGKGNQGICVGDEGGVVQDADGTAIAMLTWHISCDAFPAVVTLLAPYYDWIVGHFDS